MSHIKYDLILRRFQHSVQCHGQLYSAKIRGQMSTGLGDILQHKMPYLRAKLLHLLCIQLFKIAGLIDLVQQRLHIHTSFMRLFFRFFYRSHSALLCHKYKAASAEGRISSHDWEQKAHQRAEQHACHDL